MERLVRRVDRGFGSDYVAVDHRRLEHLDREWRGRDGAVIEDVTRGGCGPPARLTRGPGTIHHLSFGRVDVVR